MKTFKSILMAAVIASAGVSASAQSAANTAYFLEGFTYRHELNPAFAGERNYISMPLLGNLNLQLNSSVGLDNFVFPYNGKTVTFLNSAITADEFLNKLPNQSRINLNLNETLLSTGFRAFGGYNTLTVGTEVGMSVGLPKDMLKFIKVGQQGNSTTYDFKDLRVDADAVAKVSLGHSRQLSTNLRVGLKVNALLGLAHASARIDKANITLGDKEWIVDAQGSVEVNAGSGFELPTKAEAGEKVEKPGDADLIAWSDAKYNNPSLAGFGVTADLGFNYNLRDVVPGLEVSAAVKDFGYITWNNTRGGKTADKPWTFSGFQNVALNSDQPGYEDNKLGTQVDNMVDDLKDMVNFHRDANGQDRTDMPPVTATVGAEYKMPFYRALKVGVLYNHRFHDQFAWNEGRVSLNYAPCSWFELAVSGATGTYGESFGWMINFHPKGLNLFIGSDHQLYRVTPQYVPLGKLNQTVNVGVNFTFGKRKA